MEISQANLSSSNLVSKEVASINKSQKYETSTSEISTRDDIQKLHEEVSNVEEQKSASTDKVKPDHIFERFLGKPLASPVHTFLSKYNMVMNYPHYIYRAFKEKINPIETLSELTGLKSLYNLLAQISGNKESKYKLVPDNYDAVARIYGPDTPGLPPRPDDLKAQRSIDWDNEPYEHYPVNGTPKKDEYD